MGAVKLPGSDRLVDLRPGELPLFLRIFSVLLLTVAGHTLLETARDALFLARLPPRMLTIVYISAAVGMFVVTPLAVRITRSTGVRNALVLSLLFTAIGALWFRIREPSQGVVFALYVFGTLSATLLIGQCWLLASTAFTAAQSRRVSGPLAAGGVLGAIAGASIASLLLEVAPVRLLLGAAALAYFAAALVATTIVADESAPQADSDRPRLVPALQEVGRDSFLVRLAAIAALSVAVSVSVDYLFKSRVSSELAAAELAPFFARYQLALNAGTLVLQVLVTGPVVQRIGVIGLALTAPVLMAVGGAVTALGGAPFGVVVGLKATDSALRNSLGRVSSELLWAPVEQQARGRGAVDQLVTRSAQALVGAALLGASMDHALASEILAGAACVLALGWLLVGLGIRAPYIERFRRALSRGSVERDFTLAELDLTSLETVVEALARPQPRDVIAAMNVLAERKRGRLIPALILLHDDEEVLLRALELFGPSERKDWLSLGERLFEHSSPRVRQASVRAFAAADALAVLERAEKHVDPSVRTFSSIYLAQLRGRALEGDPLGWELFREDGPEHGLKLAFIESLAAHPTAQTTSILLGFAKLPALTGAVTRALEQAGDEASIPFLIERLKWPDDRHSARRAFTRLGEPALAALERALGNRELERRVRIHVPRSIAAFASEKSATLLLEAVAKERDGLVRYKALLGLEQLARETSLRIDSTAILREITRDALEYLRLFAAKLALENEPGARTRLELVLVIELVDDKIEQSRDRLARFLQVVQRGDDIRAIFGALVSGDRKRHGRAVEFLDALIRNFGRAAADVAALLRLVVDDMPGAERVRRAAELIGDFSDARRALTQLSNDHDPTIRDLIKRALDSLGSVRSAETFGLRAFVERPA
jgi:ATP:ADP antiporter, AAA family